MGKSEQTSQRFRRKARIHDNSLTSGEQSNNQPPRGADDLLLDSNISSELVSSPEQTQLNCLDLTANGACDAALPDGDVKETPLCTDDSVLPAGFPPHEDPGRPKDSCLTSYLPAELFGLCHSEITLLCTNQSLDLSACHVQKDDSVEFVVFIKNSSDSAALQLQIQISCEEMEVNHILQMISCFVSVHLLLNNYMTFFCF